MNKKCLDDELYDIYIQDGKVVIESLREIYEKGRADAIEECKEAFMNIYLTHQFRQSKAEQLEEQK